MATQSHSDEQQWSKAQRNYVSFAIERYGVKKARTLDVVQAYPEILSAALFQLAREEAH
jgi:hypothetical protein